MCSCPRPHSSESTTWAASVPADLTEIIAAAVGVQPVRPQAHLKLPMLQQLGSPQQAHVATLQRAASAPANTDSAHMQRCLSGCDGSSTLGLTRSNTLDDPGSSRSASPPLAPIRRPTLAEVRAASSDSIEGRTLLVATGASSCNDLGKQDGSNQQVDLSCQNTERQVRPVGATCPPHKESSRPVATVFDNMDDLQLPYGQLLTVLQHDSTCLREADDLTAGHEQWVPSCDMPPACDASLSQLQQQQQQQLMCQLWSHMQLQDQCKGILLPPQPLHSNSNSCCSDDTDTAVCWPADSSSLGSSGCDVLDSPSGSYVSTSSRASSICSSRSSGSEKRVTWGPVTEYQLPPEPQYSWLWDCVPSWMLHKSQGYRQQAGAGCQGRLGVGSTAVGATAAGVVVVAGIAAVVCFKRSASV